MTTPVEAMPEVRDMRPPRRSGARERTPPHNMSMEKSILGGVLVRPAMLEHLHDLEVDDFYDSRHRIVWGAIRNLDAKGRAVDVVTVQAEIEKQGRLDAVGGMMGHAGAIAFLGELTLSVPTPDNVVEYKAAVQTLARNRELLVALGSALTRALDWPHDPRELLSETLGELGRIETESKIASPEAGSWDHRIAASLVEVRSALGAAGRATRKPLFIDAHDLFTREYPPTPWLVTGLMTRGGVVQFGAEPKSGKTWLALETSIGIATGSRVCGEFFAERGIVAYFFAEDLDRQVRNRVRALLSSRGLSPEAIRGRLHVCPRGTTLDVTRDEDLAWIIASCRELGPIDLLVLDPLRDIHSGKENESDDMSNVMRRMKTLGTILGCTVAFAHHAGKPSKDQSERRAGQRSRGSGAIHGSTDSGIYFGLRGGDGRSSLELGVEVEIKGAGGAGRFSVRLDVEDDIHGEAMRATWVLSAENGTQTSTPHGARSNGLTDEDREDDDAVYEFVRELEKRGVRLPQRKLRDHESRPLSGGKPLPVKRMTASLKRLEGNRRLVRIGGVFQVAESNSIDLFSERKPGASGTRPERSPES